MIMPGKPIPYQRTQPSAEKLGELKQKIAEARFRLDPPPPPPVVLIRLAGKPICTTGNISNIQGPAKSAKSAVLGAMMAAAVKALIGEIPEEERENEDALLKFSSDLRQDPENPSVILHFDTEQSAFDHHQSVRRSLGRIAKGFTSTSGESAEKRWEELPLQSYSMVHFSYIERREAIELVIKSLQEKKLRFPCIFLDGVADIVGDPNDFDQARALVDRFHDLAREHQCAVITVLHENPSSPQNNGGKTRGHLGSHIERKSETNLRVAKDLSGKELTEISTIWAERARHCYIPKNDGVKIAYKMTTKRHEIAAESEDTKQKPGAKKNAEPKAAFDPEAVKKANVDEKRREVEDFLRKTFAAYKSDELSSGTLVPLIEVSFGCKDRTAITYLNKWRNHGWIYKGPSAKSPYRLTPFENPNEVPLKNIDRTADSPAGDPPAADPSAVNPPAVDPPAVAPPAVDPPAVDPPAVNPPAVNPPAAEPPAADPPTADLPSEEAATTASSPGKLPVKKAKKARGGKPLKGKKKIRKGRGAVSVTAMPRSNGSVTE